MARTKAQAERLGIPDGFDIWQCGPFKGINQSASRNWMDDADFFWLLNWIKVGDGNLRTLYDKGSALYTAPAGRTLVYFSFYNIGQNDYCAVFLSDGTAYQVAYPSGATIPISNASLFYQAANGQNPACGQSGTQYLLIANHNTNNDYWIWDGSVLYGAGSIAPFSAAQLTDGGSGYTSVPSYTVFGGHGSGVVLTPVVAEGSVVSLTIDNPGSGYLPGDIVQVQFSGGGSDTGAVLIAYLAAANVQHITLIAGGTGYPTGTFPLGISGGGGTGAAGTFTTTGGSVSTISLTANGSNYTASPTVSFPIPGSGAAISAIEVAGAVATLTITAGGSGYVPGTYPLGFSGPGTGASATYFVNPSGVVASTTIVAGGTGYATNPTVSIPTGSGAEAVAYIYQGGVSSISVLNGGSGFSGTPTLTLTGGGGTGATATAVVSGETITSVTVTAAGSGYQDAPAVEVQVGVNNAAAAILSLMPYGVSGTSLETYQSRVWLSYPNQVGSENNGGTMFLSGPESLTDFATSNGGLIFTNTDRFLRKAYTALRQSGSFLYAIGDSSVSVISNVQTTGGSSTSSPTTTFTYQNSDPQFGTPYRDTVEDFSNNIVFANAFGVFGIYGGSVRKVSGKIDKLFSDPDTNPIPSAIVQSAASANIFAQPVYVLLLTIRDPFTQNPENVLLIWTGKDWFAAQQSASLTFIGTFEHNSDIDAWGTDGTSLFPLFSNPSPSLVKSLSTKAYGGTTPFLIKGLHTVYLDAIDQTSGQTGISFSGSVDAIGIAVPAINSMTAALQSAPSGNLPFQSLLTFQAPQPLGAIYAAGWGAGIPQGYGTCLGVTLATTCADMVLRNAAIGYMPISAVA